MFGTHGSKDSCFAYQVRCCTPCKRNKVAGLGGGGGLYWNHCVHPVFLRPMGVKTAVLQCVHIKFIDIPPVSITRLGGGGVILLHLYTPSWQLRSSTDTQVFRISSFQTKSCGQHSFSCQARVTWNQLPVSVHLSTSVSSFKSLKKLFFSLIALICHRCVCVCIYVCACACVCESCCMRWILTICICKEYVSA